MTTSNNDNVRVTGTGMDQSNNLPSEFMTGTFCTYWHLVSFLQEAITKEKIIRNVKCRIK
jgi:hypothetical protein